MEEVHSTNGNGETMLGAQFARSADGILPVEFRVRPVTKADFLFEEADYLAGFGRDDDTRAFKLAERVEDLEPLAWRPYDFEFGKEVEGLNGHAVVGVIRDLASDPPRPGPTDRHFFNVRRKATPSNSPLPPTTARASAIARVMRGQGFSAALRFDLCAEVFISHGWSYGCRKWSKG
jgi:hypothetical protein